LAVCQNGPVEPLEDLLDDGLGRYGVEVFLFRLGVEGVVEGELMRLVVFGGSLLLDVHQRVVGDAVVDFATDLYFVFVQGAEADHDLDVAGLVRERFACSSDVL